MIFFSYRRPRRYFPTRSNLATRLTDTILLNTPLVSSAMDTVTEHRTAIAMAREGGIGIIHKNMSIDQQVLEVERVKKSESGMIIDPITVTQRPVGGRGPGDHEHLQDLRSTGPASKANWSVSSPTGISVSSPMTDLRVADVMTSKNLVTAKVGIDLEHSKALLHEHRIEKLLVVDDNGESEGTDHHQGSGKDQEISSGHQGHFRPSDRRRGPRGRGKY